MKQPFKSRSIVDLCKRSLRNLKLPSDHRKVTESVAIQKNVKHQLKYSAAELQSLLRFQYEPLEHGKIRVFELFPGRSCDPIAGTLRTVSLDEAHQPYEALSYVWGDPALAHTIACCGHKFNVTTSLHSALLRLRKSRDSLVIWADGICIDQGSGIESLRERSHQVSMMSKIFSKASRVIIDLGETDQNFDYMIKKLEKSLARERHTVVEAMWGPINKPGGKISDEQDTKLWYQFIRLMKLPWFMRLWCLQESVLASQSAILLGTRLIHHFDFLEAIQQATIRLTQVVGMVGLPEAAAIEIESGGGSLRRNLLVIPRRQAMREAYQSSRELSMEQIVLASQSLDATDARDRLYALYALLPREVMADFTVDYTETLETLQRRFSIQLFERQYGVWALFFACGPGFSQPSWTLSLVRDESHYWRQYIMAQCATSVDASNETDYREMGLLKIRWKAGGTLPSILRLGSESGEICTQGSVFDHITNLSERLDAPNLDESFLNGLDSAGDWLVKILYWALDANISEDALWRTLMFDGYHEARWDVRYSGAEERDAAYIASYESLKELLIELEDDEPDIDLEEFKRASLFLNQVLGCMPNMRLAVTSNGTVAAVPHIASVGDRVMILSGIPAPFVLREQGGKYELVGGCYLHGFMEGQFTESDNWDPEPLTIF